MGGKEMRDIKLEEEMRSFYDVCVFRHISGLGEGGVGEGEACKQASLPMPNYLRWRVQYSNVKFSNSKKLIS